MTTGKEAEFIIIDDVPPMSANTDEELKALHELWIEDPELRQYELNKQIENYLPFGGFFNIEKYREKAQSHEYTDIQKMLFGEPRKATFISDKPLSKRARRRMRGRSK